MGHWCLPPTAPYQSTTIPSYCWDFLSFCCSKQLSHTTLQLIYMSTTKFFLLSLSLSLSFSVGIHDTSLMRMPSLKWEVLFSLTITLWCLQIGLSLFTSHGTSMKWILVYSADFILFSLITSVCWALFLLWCNKQYIAHCFAHIHGKIYITAWKWIFKFFMAA